MISIGKVEALHTLTVAGAGLLIALLLTYGVGRLEEEQRIVGADAVYLSDLQRLNDSLRQWLLMGDLIYGSGETYLIEGARSQGNLAKDILATLTTHNLPEAESKRIQHITELMVRNEQRLTQAASISPETESEVAYQLLMDWDVDAAASMTTLQQLSQGIQAATLERKQAFSQFRQRLITIALLAGAAYLVLIVGMWAWVRAVLVNPLKRLTGAADDALRSDTTLDLVERGPIEVRRLTRSTKAFIELLESKVQDRTKALKDRETALVAEIASKQAAQMEAAIALAAAEDASAAKSEFLANMSHEIRTPLNGILGGTELALRETRDPETEGLLKTVLLSGQQLLGVINDVLDFSKLDAGQLTLEHAAFRIRDVLQDIANMFAASAADKHLDLVLCVDPALPTTLIGDGQRIRQVLSNLINNSIKFTEQGEVVIHAELLSLDHKGAELKLSVQDTGCGIPLNKQAQIFEPFKQADGSSTRHWSGTGLGLSICRQFVELMGGTIAVASTEGEGSTFACNLHFEIARDSRDRSDNSVCWIADACLSIRNPTLQQSIARELEADGWQVISRPSKAQVNSAALWIADSVCFEQHAPDTANSRQLIIVLKDFADRRRLESSPNRIALHMPIVPSAIHEPINKFFSRTNSQAPPSADKELVQAHKKVLVVEDNKTNQMIACKMLESFGCSVAVADSGLEGVTAVQNERFDLVLMDWHMPGMDGLQATAAIRRWEAEQAVPKTTIYALTANAMQGDADQCLAAGMDDVLTKPINLKALASALDRLTVTSPARTGTG